MILLLVWLAFPLLMQAQQPAFRQIDSLTYALYQQQKWNDLIETGSRAISEGYDYYYMQMRVGIAWYELAKYRQSIPHFRKALHWNPGDLTATGYLYSAYLKGGRPDDAQKLAGRLTPQQQKTAGLPASSLIEELYLETGPGFAGNQDLTNHRRMGHRMDTIYNNSFYYNRQYYVHGGLRIDPMPGLSIYQGYSRISTQVLQKIDYMGQQQPDFNETAIQQEYYGNLALTLPAGVSITPAWHFIWLDYDLRRDFYNEEFYRLDYDTVNVRINDYVLALSARKEFSVFALELAGSLSHFEHGNISQFGLFGYTYPLGNLDLYTRTGLILKSAEENNDLIFNQLVGFALTPKTWFEAEATIGQLRDFNERNAFVVYNVPEKINYKIEGNLILELSRHLELSLRYRYMQRENVRYTFTDYTQSETVLTNYPYHTFIVGIKWRF